MPCHDWACRGMSCHGMLHHIIQCHGMSRRSVTSVMACRGMPWYVATWYGMACHALPSNTMACMAFVYVLGCLGMPRHGMLWHVWHLWHVVSCLVVSFRGISWFVGQCRATALIWRHSYITHFGHRLTGELVSAEALDTNSPVRW